MPCRETLIHTAFGKAEEIDDEPLFAEALSSIFSRPPGELEYNARGRGQDETLEAENPSEKKKFS